jgi:hypothetical protein
VGGHFQLFERVHAEFVVQARGQFEPELAEECANAVNQGAGHG